MKTKPFNLEAALKGAKVVTRDGKTITSLKIITDGRIQPLQVNNGSYYYLDGRWTATNETHHDLFLLDEPKQYTLPLSRRDVYEITRDKYLWLSQNPGKSKRDWFNLNPNVPELDQGCACCEFTIGQRKPPEAYRRRNCNLCPLTSLWGNSADACMLHTSPYFKWESSGRTDTKAAKQISDAAVEELRKMDAFEKGLSAAQQLVKDFPKKEEPKDPYAELKQAHKEGKVIQTRSKIIHSYTDWQDSLASSLAWIMPIECYRIKPTPRYRAWTAEEVPVGAWMRSKGRQGSFSSIIGVAASIGIMTVEEDIEDMFVRFHNSTDYEYSTDKGKTWSPCGVLVEE